MAEASPYWMRFRGEGVVEASCHDGEVHSILMVATAARPDMKPMVRMNARPEEPAGMRVLRTYRWGADAVELTYSLEEVPS